MKKSIYLIIFLSIFLIQCGKNDARYIQGYVEGEPIYLSSPFGGKLIEKKIERGQTVKKGQLLFRLDENPEAIQLKAAESELLEAKKIYEDLVKPARTPEILAIQAQINETDAKLSLAAQRVTRTKQLIAKKAIDQDTVDEAISNYNALLKQKERYIANLSLAKQGSREEQINAQQARISTFMMKMYLTKWQIEQKNIRAPAEGIILDTFYNPGDYVNPIQPVASLLTQNNTRIEFFVNANILANLQLGQTIHFSCFGCDEKHEIAVISYISPEAEYLPPLVYSRENSHKLVFRIKARINKANRYHPGQPVTVDLHHA